MLETKNLVKIYKPKKGVPVTALNGVTLKFPEKGMVFLLGKSGSGKSTLLNVLGGLDKYDNGEIIIKGVSSATFKQKHFDSYRNTYVGFIFQEYNVLEEFSVGANIALAIELQGRKADDKTVNGILKEVDLEGYGNRKPNELSGGQKQRVAIARALVKNPQIIMADEPTGALDSNTGRQIFETLKKLSKSKLVIVVSHDREFAENYADRIIELADGRVISDVEYDNNFTEEAQTLSFNGNVIEIPEDYHITEQDRERINEYIKGLKGKTNLKVTAAAQNRKFVKTDETRIKSQDGSAFKLIRSKLPLKNAFKIGGSGLKHKKIRLVITILLSCISFGLFGLADTFGAYNHTNACTNSLVDSNVKYVATAKSKHIGEGVNAYWRDYGYKLSQEDLDKLEENTGVEMHGVYFPLNSELSFNNHINPEIKLTDSNFEIYNTYFSGFAEINSDVIYDMEFKLLAGTLPDGSKKEIAISEYTFEVFKKANYTDGMASNTADGKVNLNYSEISTYADIIGKTLEIGREKYIITAVIDTNLNLDRYIHLAEGVEYKSNAEQLVDYVLFNEFNFAFQYSYAGLAMVGDGAIQKMIAQRPPMAEITEGYISFHSQGVGVDSNYLARLEDVKNEKIIWIDGERETLGAKEIVVTTDTINYWEEENGKYLEDGASDYETIMKNTTLDCNWHIFSDNEWENESGYTVVGYIDVSNENCELFSTVVCADSLYNKFTEGNNGYYGFCVGQVPKAKSDIKNMVEYCYREDSPVRYQIQNSVTYELDGLNDILKRAAKIFLYIGLGFALFAALMLSNFIATSISYKKQEIGILRAIGSRGNDVFRIFFAESFIIAMINFVLSATGVAIGTALLNWLVRNEVGILVTVLQFGLRQILLLFAVSVAVAFIASYIPVKRIASKRPIDAIRDR